MQNNRIHEEGWVNQTSITSSFKVNHILWKLHLFNISMWALDTFAPHVTNAGLFLYATLRESKSLTMRKMILKKVYQVNINLSMCRIMEARVSSLIPVLLWMEMIDTGDLQVPLRTPRSIISRWIAVSWPRPLLKLHLINFPHIWCRNIEWCMRSFIDSSCWEWKWSIHCRRSLSVFAEHRDRCYSGE